jgi:uncharacterized membrane protein YjfL (UPF0719 family)
MLILLAAASTAWAQPQPAEASLLRWQPTSLLMATVSTLLFGSLGILLAIVGFKLFDLVVPFHLEAEICEKQNIAASILSAGMIVGICLVVAAAVL